MMIFIGLFYLLLVVPGLFQHHSTVAQVIGWKEIKFLLLGIFYVAGAVFFFRRWPAGWVLCFAGLLNVVIIALVFVVRLSQAGRADAFALMSLAFLVLVVLAWAYLLGGETRHDYLVNNKTYLQTIFLYGLLLTVTYVL